MTNSDIWPDAFVGYKQTPEFTETTVPKALLRTHATKDGVWARLHVLDGRLKFFDEITGEQTLLSTGIHPCIFPARRHHIAADGPVRFFLEFCRQKDDGLDALDADQGSDFPHR